MRVFQLPFLLTKYDLVLGPLYFVLIVVLAFYIKVHFYKNSPLRQYLLPGLLVALICNVIQAVIHNFLYPSGDMQNYYSGAAEIWNATKANPVYGLELVFKPVADCSAKAQEFANHMAFEYFADSNRLMFQIAGFIGMFCFGSYLPISLIFTCLGYMGLWRIFKSFCNEFPQHTRLIFITCMLTPSVVMWCTNVIKEPLCMFGFGLCFEALYALVKRRLGYWHLLGVIVGATLVLNIKDYIFYGFIIASLPALYILFLKSAVPKVYKQSSKIALLLLFLGTCIWMYNYSEIMRNGFESFFLKKISPLQDWQVSQGGSTYIIPNVNDFSLWGVISTYLLSLNVALFRPYIWEVKNVLALLSALEVLVVFITTIYLLVRLRFVGFFAPAGKNPMLMFALVYTFFMAPMVGLIAFNFGTLVRYKLPFVPFFYTYLLLLFVNSAPKKLING